jgi:hypothetical protein
MFLRWKNNLGTCHYQKRSFEYSVHRVPTRKEEGGRRRGRRRRRRRVRVNRSRDERMDVTVVRPLLAIKASRSDSRFGERCLRFNALVPHSRPSRSLSTTFFINVFLEVDLWTLIFTRLPTDVPILAFGSVVTFLTTIFVAFDTGTV